MVTVSITTLNFGFFDSVSVIKLSKEVMQMEASVHTHTRNIFPSEMTTLCVDKRYTSHNVNLPPKKAVYLLFFLIQFTIY